MGVRVEVGMGAAYIGKKIGVPIRTADRAWARAWLCTGT
jgi:hypothetical protein